VRPGGIVQAGPDVAIGAIRRFARRDGRWQMGLMRVLLLSALATLAVGCAARGRPPIPPLSPTAPPAPAVITFIEDDYPRALADAKASGKPLFVDAWAPWCHTCLSMRSYVFTDEALRPIASRFVWLSIDTEKPGNAGFVEHYPMQSWPTLWVVDAKTEAPTLKWPGSATAGELASLLEDTTAPATAEASAARVRGERASAAGNRDLAIREYRAALEGAPPRWPERARTDEALVTELWAAKDDGACASLADAEMAKLPPGTSLANVGLMGLECARRAPLGSPAKALAARLARAVEQIALDPSVPILDDDRSGLFEEVVDDRNDDHDPVGAKSLATSWAAMLEAHAAAAKTPSARAVFDAHRVLAYVALGDPARALPMLVESERDFPLDYNPPARIARVDLELHRYDEALAAVQRALAKGYGPRKLKLYLLEADILKAKGEVAEVNRVVGEALTFASGLPAAERPGAVIADLEKRRSLLAQ
jgi:tetratricopeptide (TPR) repeat protein